MTKLSSSYIKYINLHMLDVNLGQKAAIVSNIYMSTKGAVDRIYIFKKGLKHEACCLNCLSSAGAQD